MKRKKQTIRSRRRGKTLRLLLAAVLALALCACGRREPGRPESTPVHSPSAAPTAAPTPAAPSPSPAPETTEAPQHLSPEEALTIACEPFSEYDPFDEAEGPDLLLLRLTQTPLLCRRADGSFSETAEGAGAAGLRVVSRGDGSTVLRIAMRENIRYSDGSYADVDDLLFTLYVLLDPDYDGRLALRDCAIAGLEAYRTATSPAVLEKYEALYGEASAGEGPLSELARVCLRNAWSRSMETLTERCRRDYLKTYAPYALGLSPEEAEGEPGALRAFTLWCAGLAEAIDAGGGMTDLLGNRWEPAAGVLPEEGDLIDLFTACFGSAAAFDKALGMETERLAREEFIRRCGAVDPENVPPTQISGVTRVDDYTVDLLLESFSSRDLERLGRLWLLPLPAYGEEALFRPSEGSYGFPRGDLSALRERAVEVRLGAGAFRIADPEEEFHLEANLYYYMGSPKVGEIWFRTGPQETLIPLVSRGEADLACLPGTPENLALARELPDLALRTVSTEVWGVLTMAMAKVPGTTPEALARSELDRALLELAAVCCRISAGEYFGGAALPVPSEETEERAWELFRQALARMPEGEKLSFTALVPGGGRGDHPCWEGLRRLSQLLTELDVELLVRDFPEDGDFWAAVDAGEGDLWASAERLGELPEEQDPGPDRRAVYRRLDLLVLNSRRFDLLSLPVELSWARDHISVVETLELK